MSLNVKLKFDKLMMVATIKQFELKVLGSHSTHLQGPI